MAGVLGIRLERIERHLPTKGLQRAWAEWVLSRIDSQERVLVVDETKRGSHLNGLRVGLA